VANFFQRFTHKTATITSWHRYGSKLRHCHLVYTVTVSRLVRCCFGIKLHLKQTTVLTIRALRFVSVSRQLIWRDLNLFQIYSQIFYIKSRSFDRNLYTSNRISKCSQVAILKSMPIAAIRPDPRIRMYTVFRKSDTFVIPYISHSFWTNFMKLSANGRK